MDKLIQMIKLFWAGVTKAFPTSVNDQITDAVTQVPAPVKVKKPRAKKVK